MEASGSCPFLSAARGVADVTASAVEPIALSLVCGATKLVMSAVQDAIMNARPPSAGLMKFLPMPPKSILTTMIANTPPMTGIHTGAVTGTL